MQNNVNPGYGYRILQTGETIIQGDDWCDEGTWRPCTADIGSKIGDGGIIYPRRRKIEPPAGYEIVPENEKPDTSGKYFWNRRGNFLWSNIIIPYEPNETAGQIVAEGFGHLAFARKIKEHTTEPPAGIRRKIEAQPSNIVDLKYGDYIVVTKNSDGYRPAATPFIHDLQADAEEEAQRLARLHGGKFVVFKAVKAFERGEIPVNEVAA
jgi:hypothetical protein